MQQMQQQSNHHPQYVGGNFLCLAWKASVSTLPVSQSCCRTGNAPRQGSPPGTSSGLTRKLTRYLGSKRKTKEFATQTLLASKLNCHSLEARDFRKGRCPSACFALCLHHLLLARRAYLDCSDVVKGTASQSAVLLPFLACGALQCYLDFGDCLSQLLQSRHLPKAATKRGKKTLTVTTRASQTPCKRLAAGGSGFDGGWGRYSTGHLLGCSSN